MVFRNYVSCHVRLSSHLSLQSSKSDPVKKPLTLISENDSNKKSFDKKKDTSALAASNSRSFEVESKR